MSVLSEPAVIRALRTRRSLQSALGVRFSHLYTDAHHTLLPYKVLKPFQRFTLDMGDFVAHPDLVGQLDDGETLIAIEAKGGADILKGLAQAELYQEGFHQTYLAADADALGIAYTRLARQKNVGLLAVAEDVHVLHTPIPHLPRRDAHRTIARQMDTVIQVASASTFQYNVPTHYLAWTVSLKPHRIYPPDQAKAALAGYPMPQGWRGALQGAQKLGLVRTHGGEAMLTPLGQAVGEIIGGDVVTWADVHHQVGRRGSSLNLVDVHPAAAAALRMILIQEPMVRLVIEGLERSAGKEASFEELAQRCDGLDHARAPIFFFNPERIEGITDSKGRICWEKVTPSHYRSRMFYQYKSILKHAGLLADTGLGGSTSRNYDPAGDRWRLR